MEYIAIGMIGTGLWMALEIYCAPMMDENGRIIKEGKKFVICMINFLKITQQSKQLKTQK